MKTVLALAAAAAMIAAPAAGFADTSAHFGAVLGPAWAPPADGAVLATDYGKGFVAPPSANFASAPREDEPFIANATLKSCNEWAYDYRKWRLVRAC